MIEKTPQKKGSKAKLRDYFTAHVGVILNSSTLRDIAGTSEWGRRVRELRNEEGMNIVTHNDHSDLKPGEYMLVNLKPIPSFERGYQKEPEHLCWTVMALPAKCVVLQPENLIHMIPVAKQDYI